MFNNYNSLVTGTLTSILIKEYNILFILLVTDILKLKKILYKRVTVFLNYLYKSIELA